MEIESFSLLKIPRKERIAFKEMRYVEYAKETNEKMAAGARGEKIGTYLLSPKASKININLN